MSGDARDFNNIETRTVIVFFPYKLVATSFTSKVFEATQGKVRKESISFVISVCLSLCLIEKYYKTESNHYHDYEL
jgi:hypothetical protein